MEKKLIISGCVVAVVLIGGALLLKKFSNINVSGGYDSETNVNV